MITYLDEFLPIKLYQPLTTWSCKVTWQTKTIISPLALCLWPPNGEIPCQALIIESYKTLTTWPCKVTWQKILYISITRVPKANKLGRMMTSLDGLWPIMSHDTLITWPCEIRGSLTGEVSARKRLRHHRLLVSKKATAYSPWKLTINFNNK